MGFLKQKDVTSCSPNRYLNSTASNSLGEGRSIAPRIDFLCGGSEGIVSTPQTSNASGRFSEPTSTTGGDDQIHLHRLDLLHAETMHRVTECGRGDKVVVRCHFKVKTRVASVQCALTMLDINGAQLFRKRALLGNGKPFFKGEAALVDFCIEIPELCDGKYPVQVSDSEGFLLGCALVSVGPSAGQSESTLFVRCQVSTLPAWRDSPPVAHVIEREGQTLVSINEHTFRVEPHWLWEQFGSGWEQDTFDVFQRYIRADRPYVDVGAWVGPTIIYAAALGAPRIVSVEANPRTAEHLARTVGYNPSLKSNVEIVNRCIHNKTGTFSFGNADGSDATSSASSLRGTGFQVDSIGLFDLLESTNTLNASLVKIDVEGAEVFIGTDLARLSSQRGLAIHLSLHPPFWAQMGNSVDLLDALRLYRLHWPNGDKADVSEVVARSTSGDEFPPWGTAYGNFFELVLLSEERAS